MTTFNSKEKNTFHYLTIVAFRRVPIFTSETIARFFIEVLAETREKNPFKLIGYVIMPDHIHLILNSLNCDISAIGKTLKGSSARKIIDWLKENRHFTSLEKLQLNVSQKRNHQFAVWQKKVTSIDLHSPKFIRQKLNYLHLNPIRAGLCDHPAKWKWSSYRACLPHEKGGVPIEMDLRGYWRKDEFNKLAVKDRL